MERGITGKILLAIKLLRRTHEEEVEDRSTIHGSLQKEYNSTQGRIDNLLDMRLQKLITDEEYITQKNKLIKEKIRLEERLRDNNYRADSWLDTAERAFNFASRASYWFDHGTIEDKKAIIQCFGSNFILKDRNLHAEIRQPFVVIKDCLTGLEKESNRLELLQTATQSRGATPILSKNLTGWAQ